MVCARSAISPHNRKFKLLNCHTVRRKIAYWTEERTNLRAAVIVFRFAHAGIYGEFRHQLSGSGQWHHVVGLWWRAACRVPTSKPGTRTPGENAQEDISIKVQETLVSSPPSLLVSTRYYFPIPELYYGCWRSYHRTALRN